MRNKIYSKLKQKNSAGEKTPIQFS